MDPLGALTTIMVVSVINAELWKPLPFQDSRQLVVVEVRHAAELWLFECELARIFFRAVGAEGLVALKHQRDRVH